MTLLVTGDTGLLGRALVDLCRRRGLVVIGASRNSRELACDIADDASVARLLDRARPAVVVNTAALTNIDRCDADPVSAWQINARAVAFLAHRCRERDARLVQISTDHYFVGSGPERHDENAPVTLVNEYARCKYAGEAFALANADSLVVRTNFTGRRGVPGEPTLLEWLFDAAVSRRPVTLFADVFVSTIDVGAAARGILDLVDRRVVGVVNLASREVFSKKTLLERVAVAIGHPLTAVKSGGVSGLRTRRATNLGLDVRRAEGLLNYRLPGLADVVTSLAREFQPAAGEA